jgi:hypothetical protein
LKSIENTKMQATIRGRVGARGVSAMNSAQSGMANSMKGRRRPRRVQRRSLQAPTTGWITAPSMERVLLIRLTSSTLLLGISSGSTALLKM